MAQSKRLTLNTEDWKRSLRNALVFAAPALLVLLADLSTALPDWFSGSYLVVALFVINILTDLLRKLLAGK